LVARMKQMAKGTYWVLYCPISLNPDRGAFNEFLVSDKGLGTRDPGQLGHLLHRTWSVASEIGQYTESELARMGILKSRVYLIRCFVSNRSIGWYPICDDSGLMGKLRRPCGTYT
jgi:hypothetical protein